MSAPCSSPLADVVKIAEVAKARKGSVFQLECVPASARDDASDIACASVIVCVVVDPLVVSSDCTDCDRIEGDDGVSSSCCCCCREPCEPTE
jgi:hypothetical protein